MSETHYMDDSVNAPLEVERLLHEHSTATIRFGSDVTESIRYTFDESGHLIAALSRELVSACDALLFIPDQSDTTLEVMVTPEEIDADSAAADRWKIYHRDSDGRAFARLYIEAAKYGEHIIDGESVTAPNPLATDEPRLCKMMNQEHRDDLRPLCAASAKVDVGDPVMVGVDAFGFDIRARFGIVRVPFESEETDADAVRSRLQIMIAAVKGSTTQVSDEQDTPPA